MDVNVKVTSESENHFFDGVQSTDLFLKLLNHKKFALALTDDNGNIILSNNLFIKKVLQGPARPDFRAIIKEENGRPFLTEDQVIHFNTGNQVIELTFLKLVEKPEGAGYLWMVSNDIEATLHHKITALKNLYRSFIDTSFELIFRTSVEGQILFCNSLFLQSFGFDDYKKLKGSHLASLFESEEQYKETAEKLLSEQRVDGEIIFFRKPGGKRLTGKVNCHFHTNESGVALYTWTVLDISQQIESETILKTRNDELAKVNHQMERFLYSTSHDLRSPITSILGLVNLVRMESKEPVVLDYVAKIESSTQRLDKIIRDIMTFSRATYKRSGSERINFDILSWKAFNNYRSDPHSKKIHFEVKSTGDAPFYGDSERLDIIFDNVVRNAIQFYDSNKSRPFIQVNITSTKANSLVEFIDNGIGIGKQHQDHIFNMFYKATHFSRGAGLGLYIVKETVEKLGATISLESEIGFGTVLRLTIPNDPKGHLLERKIQLMHQG